MSLFKKTLATAILSATAMSASAALVEVQSQSQSYDNLTSWSNSFVFDRYDASQTGGAELLGVRLSYLGETSTDLFFTALTDGTSFYGSSVVYLDAAIAGQSYDINLATDVDYATRTSTIELNSGETYEANDLNGSDTSSLELSDAASLIYFTGPGTFTVDLLAEADTNLTFRNGNADYSQATVATGTYTVSYLVDDASIVTPPPANGVPLPGTLALMGLGLVAVAARKKAKA
jgi:uncharacterized membrane protein